VRTVGQLSYRQLVSLAVFAEADGRYLRDLARAAGRRKEGQTAPSPAVESEIDALGDLGLVGVRIDGKGPFRQGSRYGSQASMGQQDFGALRLLDLGDQLLGLMRLDEIPEDDKRALLADLARAPGAPS